MRTLRASIVAIIVLVLGAFAFAKLTSDNGPVARSSAFGHGLSNVTVSTATKTLLSPDATQVALVDSGVLTVVRMRDGGRVMRTGANVVDAAWMPDGKRIIVVEGPTPTGEIDAVDMRGRIVGVAHLQTPVEFGNGLGLSVDAHGTRAAVIAVTREAIGGAMHSDLAVVDLQTGAARVFATASEERNPVFVDDETIGLLVSDAKRTDSFVVRNLATGTLTPFDDGPVEGPFAVSPAGEVVLGRQATAAGSLFALDPETAKRRDLRSLGRDHLALDVDEHLTRALVRVTDRDGTVHLSVDPLT